MLKKLKYLKYYGQKLLKNWSQEKSSYAQHGEDELIDLLLPGRVSSFIDIGANDGVLFSNSYKFAKSGAVGLCIEPSSSTYRKLCLNHLFNFKVKCIHGAVSSKSGHLFLKEDGYEETLSSVDTKKSEKSFKVKSYTLDILLEKYPFFKNVDLLSVDVEGHEKEVFQGLTDTNFYSKIIIIESDKSETHDLLSLTSLNDYEPIFTNGINTVLKNQNEILPSLVKLPKGFVRC
jgi:FkbM family methyltransferase